MSSIEYRKDIDALRAIAVIVVIAFHIGIDSFSGGYIGVDVFFVISGFLITSIIKTEILNTDSFNYIHFFARRIKRLFSAYIFMMLLTFIFSFIIFFESEIKIFLESAFFCFYIYQIYF